MSEEKVFIFGEWVTLREAVMILIEEHYKNKIRIDELEEECPACKGKGKK